MKRILLVLVVMALLLGAVYGSAAAFPGGIAETTIQAGLATVDAPATAPIDVRWKTFVSYTGDFRVAGVELYFGEDCVDCEGLKVLVDTMKAPFVINGMFRGVVGADNWADCNEIYSGGWTDGVCGEAPKAEDVNRIAVLLKSGWHSYDGVAKGSTTP